MGPSALFDKSFIQALNRDEAAIFDALFRGNLSSLFYAETLADLSGGMRGGETPEEIVGNLAAKTPVWQVCHLMSHQSAALAELMGQSIPMDGRPVLGGGQHAMSGSKKGIIFDPTSEHHAFARWQKHDFHGVEKEFARAWRESLAQAPTAVETIITAVGRKLKLRDLSAVKAYVDELVDQKDRRWAVLKAAMSILQIPPKLQSVIADRWKRENRPKLKIFAPYTAHVLTVEAFFHVAAATGKISAARPSNRIDIAYLHYLPFSEVFISGDKLHERTARIFMKPFQSFVRAEDMKNELSALNELYRSCPDVPVKGLVSVARFPPLDRASQISEIFDRVRPNWRDRASARADVSPEASAKILAELKRLDAASGLKAPPAAIAADEADYIVLKRHVPLRRGRYQFLPENSARE